jgi:hypothetical protein
LLLGNRFTIWKEMRCDFARRGRSKRCFRRHGRVSVVLVELGEIVAIGGLLVPAKISSGLRSGGEYRQE